MVHSHGLGCVLGWLCRGAPGALSQPSPGYIMAFPLPYLGPGLSCHSVCRAVSQRTPSHVVEHAQSCRRARLAMSRAVPRAPCHRAPRAGCCAYRSFLRHVVVLRLTVSRPYHDTTQRPSRVPVTVRPCVSQHSTPAARPLRASRSPLRASRSPLRAPLALARGPTVSQAL